MSYDFTWLQFFADGAAGSGEGGEGAATGVDSVDAGRSTGVGAADAGQRLEDLGVPREKAELFRKRRAKTQAPVVQAPAEQPAEETPPQENPTMSWDDFMQIPENQQRLQSMMAARGKDAAAAEKVAAATMQKINPALELLALKYGIEAVDGQYDLDAITRAVTNDDSYYAQRAEALGVDIEVAKQLEQANRGRKLAEAREQALLKQQQKQEREFQLQQHFMGMRKQAEELKKYFPDFDLQRELQDPNFLRYTSPEIGMSVTDAFYSIHHDAIMQQQAEAIARRAKADAAASIRSGARPRENGSAATAAVSATPDIKHMTKEDRRAYIMAKYGPG